MSNLPGTSGDSAAIPGRVLALVQLVAGLHGGDVIAEFVLPKRFRCEL